MSQGRPEGMGGAGADRENGEQKRPRNRGDMAMGRKRQVIVHQGVFPAAGHSAKTRTRRAAGSHFIGQMKKRHANPDQGMIYTQFYLEKPDNSIIPVKMEKKRGTYKIAYRTTQGGYYRLVGYNGNEIRNGSRLHLYSFYNFMTHGDMPKKNKPVANYLRGYQNGRPMLELVRIYDSERGRYRSRAGNKTRVRVLFKGKPVANVPLTLTTSKKWSKKVHTDERGEAEFILIKDVFQEGIINKRKSGLFMLKTEHTVNRAGQLSGKGYDKEHYIATLSFRVFPNSNEWESKRIAFLVAMLMIIGAGTAIAIRRKRQRTFSGSK
jgi:hypothetical protein